MPALQSRCTRFRFAPLKPEQIIGSTKLKTIVIDIDNNTSDFDAKLYCTQVD